MLMTCVSRGSGSQELSGTSSGSVWLSHHSMHSCTRVFTCRELLNSAENSKVISNLDRLMEAQDLLVHVDFYVKFTLEHAVIDLPCVTSKVQNETYAGGIKNISNLPERYP